MNGFSIPSHHHKRNPQLHLPARHAILDVAMASFPSRLTSLPLAAPRQAFSAPLAYWHLLSLDAPTVATLWLCFIARTTHQHLAPAFAAAMFLFVWILYALDRILDARDIRTPDTLEARHHFHHRHRRAFRIAITVVTLALPPLVIKSHLPIRTFEFYAAMASALGLWFLAVHLRPTRSLPKEFVTGLFFSAALWVPFASRQALVPALLFAALCTLNCIYIHTWENTSAAPAHRTTTLARRHLPQVSLVLILVSLLRATPISIPIALAAALLVFLNEFQTNFELTTLRAAADLVLLTPVLFLPFFPLLSK